MSKAKYYDVGNYFILIYDSPYLSSLSDVSRAWIDNLNLYFGKYGFISEKQYEVLTDIYRKVVSR